ncbi:hypothetical protein QAD02_011268 [Eretmocerus hayati]|uniref:Uncharacterized protein n=1 Tax=Eretmocerus hayati TaxID=131215 RepID=A0ACC2NWK9_9HYME|nr:hypothetical protein QAD02_011268 [Eretmocerus hayati]
MAQRVTRQTRLRTYQNENNPPREEDCNNTINHSKPGPSDYGFRNDIHRLPRVELSEVPELPESNDGITTNAAPSNRERRPLGVRTRSNRLESLIPRKRLRDSSTLSKPVGSKNPSQSSIRSNSSNATSQSNSRTQGATPSFRNKSDVFNNITASFTNSKILSLQILSDITSQRRLELSSWGLPPLILEKYQSRGVTSMFPWQVECLANRKILEENKNLVYSAPTSAGKTLVAEFLVLKTVFERRKKVIFILPFVSVVREKMFYFQDLLSDSGVRVEGFMGGVAPAGGFAAVHVAIATIEKANSLINRLMEEGDLVSLGAVVIDELHLLGDPGRGYLLELLLTKLRYMSLSSEQVNIQLIGMSATLPNLPMIADWLDAELYKTDFRPIPLHEQCKIGSSLLDSKLNVVRELEPAPDIVNDTDNVIQLCIETINGGHGVLIFCPTKNWCEKLALQLAASFFQLGRDNTHHGQILRNNINLTSVQEVLVQLQHSPVGLDNVLKKTVSFGIAFHHAGLTMDERDIIEGAFRIGSLKVLIATSTLSSGVNLPARRVIIRSPIFNGRTLDKLTYHQMIGRAGRMGKDTAGESILICKPNERALASNLMTSSLEPIVSCLEGSGPLIRALLEAIASQIVRTPKDLDLYSKCSFVYKCEDNEVKKMVDDAVQFLISNEFLQLRDVEGVGENEDRRLVATSLGKACLAASIAPRDGLLLFEELQRARKCFVLDTELHVVYLVTPFSSAGQIGPVDWMTFMDLWRSLSESERRVGQLVGVEERFLGSAMRGVVKSGKTLNVHRRFFTAMALHDLVREVPLNTVCRKFSCNRGLLQSLQQSSSTFAGMVTNFCRELKWDCMELLFAQFQARLQFGVCRDLLDLLRLPSLNGLRARSLFKHGITTAAELAVAHELDVEEALNKALPFESEKDFDGGNEAEVAKRAKMRSVFITGKDGLTAQEAAVIVIREARALVKNELGVRDVNWSQSSSSNSVSRNSTIKTAPVTPSDNAISLRPLSALSGMTSSRSPSIESRPSSFDQRLDATTTPVQPQTTSTLGRQTSGNILLNNCIPEEDIPTAPVTTITPSTVQMLSMIRISDAPKPTSSSSPNPVNEIRTSDANQSMCLFSQDIADQQQNFDQKDSPLAGNCIPSESQDVVNRSNEVQSQPTSHRSLRSRLNEKTRSLVEDHMTINSADFRDSPEAPVKPNNKQQSPSFQVTSQALDEIMRIVEDNQARIEPVLTTTTIPTTSISTSTTISARNSINTNNRVSAGSNASNSLFSDSSLFDAQAASILEKNVMNSTLLAEFEQSEFGSQAKRGSNVPATTTEVSKKLNEKEDSTSQQQQQVPSTWTEDSWDVARNELVSNEENGSPSLLQQSRVKTRMHMTASSAWTRSRPIESPLIGSPKSVALKRTLGTGAVGKISPLASAALARTRVETTTTVPKIVSLNQSDSDESVVNSQTNDTHRTVMNKTRRRIEQKILTQKLAKSVKSGSCSPAAIARSSSSSSSSSRQLRREAVFRKSPSTSSDEESGPIFNSEMMASKKLEKKTQDAPSLKAKISRTTNRMGTRGDKEKLKASDIKSTSVTESRRVFNKFRAEIEGTESNEPIEEIAIAFVTETHGRDASVAIGHRVVGIEDKTKTKKGDSIIYGAKKICGIVFSWGAGSLYYMSFSNTPETKITLKERIAFLKDIVSNFSITLRCFDAKETFKIFYKCFDIEPRCKFLDPKAGDWLMNTEICHKSFTELTAQYFPRGSEIARMYENNYGMTRIDRAAVKTLLAWYISEPVLDLLEKCSLNLSSAFREIEMPTILTLASMEMRGFGINVDSLLELSVALKNDLARIELTAFKLAGRKFNFYSSKEVSQVLGLSRGRGGTNKAALKSCENPISNLITLWRKLSTVQTKIIFPLLHLDKNNGRIHGNCITYTVTGRVSMHEPNLQTIPRDFTSEISGCIFSARMAFVPEVGNVMLSADFCQLELRILTHFSRDPVLTKLMHEEGDIFRNIAARMNKVAEEEVNDDMRQRAKGLCYAMIYGMGTKSLADSLGVTESAAKDYLEAFMGTYKGIREWLKAVVEQARTDGFVTTLTDRRRYLPGITSETSSTRAQAERQAVNTKVQGSAADITKKAMVLIESKLREEFSYLPLTFPCTEIKRKLRSSDADSRPRGAYLILQLHDELLYEVNTNDLEIVARIVKESMEHAIELRVPLPVKVKVGPAWGNLEEYKF